jgi:hypothetical protein
MPVDNRVAGAEGGPVMPKAQKDVIAGVIFAALGLAFALASLRYDLGTALRMGPGYFPLVLGGALVFLGVGIVAQGVFSGDREPLGAIPWRGLVLLTLAVLFFGFTVRRLGLAPALFGAVLLAAFSSHRTTVVMALAMAVGLTALCSLIFVQLLSLPVPLLGPWLRF